jgi:hypothetical protein
MFRQCVGKNNGNRKTMKVPNRKKAARVAIMRDIRKLSPDPRQVPTGRADPEPASIPSRAMVDSAGEGRQGNHLDK